MEKSNDSIRKEGETSTCNLELLTKQPECCVQEMKTDDGLFTLKFDGYLQYKSHHLNPGSKDGFLPIKVKGFTYDNRGTLYIDSDVGLITISVTISRFITNNYQEIELKFVNGSARQAMIYYDIDFGDCKWNQKIDFLLYRRSGNSELLGKWKPDIKDKIDFVTLHLGYFNIDPFCRAPESKVPCTLEDIVFKRVK